MKETSESITGTLFPALPSPDARTLARAISADYRWSALHRQPAPEASPAAADPNPTLHIYNSVLADFQEQKNREPKPVPEKVDPSSSISPRFQANEHGTEAPQPDVPSRGKHALIGPVEERVSDIVVEGRPGQYMVAVHAAVLTGAAAERPGL